MGPAIFNDHLSRAYFYKTQKVIGEGPSGFMDGMPGVSLDKLSPGNSIQRSRVSLDGFHIIAFSNCRKPNGYLISSSKNTQQTCTVTNG